MEYLVTISHYKDKEELDKGKPTLRHNIRLPAKRFFNLLEWAVKNAESSGFTDFNYDDERGIAFNERGMCQEYLFCPLF